MANIGICCVTPRQEHVLSHVRGHQIVVTPESFARVTGAPRVQDAQFSFPGVGAPEDFREVSAEICVPGTHWLDRRQMPIRVLTPRYTPLYIFCCSTIFPIVRHSEIKRDRARLLWAIGTGRSIDLPLYMYRVFCEDYLRPRSQGSIPFGCILTRLIEEVLPGRIPGVLREQPSKGPIDRSTIRRSAAHLAQQPQPQQPQPQPQQPQPAQPAEEQIPAPALQMMMQTLQQMQDMLAQQGQAMETMTATLTQHGQALAQMTGVHTQQSTVIGRLEAALAARGEELAGARADIAAARTELAEARTELAEARSEQVTHTTAVLDRIRAQASTLDQLVGDVQRLRPPPSGSSSSDEGSL